MHKVRRASLEAMVTSLLSGAHCSVTSLGRNITSKTTEKHQIKRSMRLCSNPHLQCEIGTIYAFMAHRVIGNQQYPIILVDWSDLDPRKDHFLLRASVAIEGRSLTVLEQVYPLCEKEKPAIHKAFMSKLKSMLPPTCKPIIVSDAGFRIPWFKLIESLGWDFVGRVRNKTMCKQNSDDEWFLTRELYCHATSTEKSLGRYIMRRNDSFEMNLVIYKQNKKGRKNLTATGERSRASSNSRSNASREQEPWLLATSLPTKIARHAKKVVKIYRTRMQIEESFRDLKTGLNFNASKTRTQDYLSVLLLLAILGQYVLFLLGMAVKLSNQHLRYQANSVKTRLVLSYQFIGLRAFKDRYLKLQRHHWQAAISKIQMLMQEPLNV
ncbi:MAG: IS4 family transposase [Gammaproteobacteria bacterium]|nr:IS4 family transposase [Gammaproteobacteria bacterium]